MRGASLGAIEAGGTKFLCAKWDATGALVERTRIDTAEPGLTLDAVLAFFRNGQAVDSLGIGSFGPLCLTPGDPRYGALTVTSKLAWQGVALLDEMRKGLGVPVAIASDVEAAALGEGALGAAQGLSHFAYVTVGTGIGGAMVVNGQLLRGLGHSELGHIYPPPLPDDDCFPGVCPIHGRCLEGLASGPALDARTGTSGDALASDHSAFTLIAEYLAHLCLVIDGLAAPERIIIGGGVVEARALHPPIAAAFDRLKGDYGERRSPEALADFIVPPAAPMAPGLLGARVLAQKALADKENLPE